MTILASDFSGMAPLVIAVPCMMLTALASYLWSWRGHRAGPLLAAPLLLCVVAFLIYTAIPPNTDLQSFLWCLTLMSPLLILSGGSVILWIVRRKPKS